MKVSLTYINLHLVFINQYSVGVHFDLLFCQKISCTIFSVYAFWQWHWCNCWRSFWSGIYFDPWRDIKTSAYIANTFFQRILPVPDTVLHVLPLLETGSSERRGRGERGPEKHSSSHQVQCQLSSTLSTSLSVDSKKIVKCEEKR